MKLPIVFHKSTGFTLIELLVAISIIALLSSIGLANYKTASQKARDSRRKADLEQVRGALELYRSDVGSYPDTGVFPTCGNSLEDSGNLYMRKIPCDPQTGIDYAYQKPVGPNYYLGTDLELAPKAGESPVDCESVGLTGMDYCIANP